MSQTLPILLKTGTDAERLATTQHTREPHLTSDRRELWVGGTQIVLNTLELFAPAAVSSAAIAMAAWRRHHQVKLSPAAGAGAYNAKLALPTTNRRDGDECKLSLRMPASANPTAQIYNATDAGTLLFTVAGDTAQARNYFLLCIFNAGAWELWDSREIV